MKRFAVIALCLFMLCGLVPVAAFAENVSDTENSPETVSEVIEEQQTQEEVTTEPDVEEIAEQTENPVVKNDEQEPEKPEEADDAEVPIDEELAEIEEEETDDIVAEPSGITFAELIAQQGEQNLIVITDDVIIDSDAVIGAEKAMIIERGTVTVKENAVLTSYGYVEIDGGALVVEAGAALINCGFVEVCEKGALNVTDGGAYTAQETAVLHLDISADDSVATIDGISPEYIEITLFAANAYELSQKLNNSAYAFVTVSVKDPTLTEFLGALSLGNNVSISLRR